MASQTFAQTRDRDKYTDVTRDILLANDAAEWQESGSPYTNLAATVDEESHQNVAEFNSLKATLRTQVATQHLGSTQTLGIASIPFLGEAVLSFSETPDMTEIEILKCMQEMEKRAHLSESHIAEMQETVKLFSKEMKKILQQLGE